MIIDNVLQLIFQNLLGSSVPLQRIFRQDSLLALFTHMGPLHIYEASYALLTWCLDRTTFQNVVFIKYILIMQWRKSNWSAKIKITINFSSC